MRLHKHPSLIVQQEEPFNAEPPLKLLRQAFVTPQELFFVRNHAPVPGVDPTRYRLTIAGAVKNPFELSLGEIQNNFPKQTVVATLQCAGNRRTELMAVGHIPGEVPWLAGVISNAVWAGAPLREILQAAQPADGARHVAFTGLDEVEKRGRRFGYGGSIAIEKAMGPEVLLAYEMNGGPLPPTHGFPLRIIVPGYIGARSVKWLSNITVQAEPSANYYQTHAYKLFPPDVGPETVDWTQGTTIEEVFVNSVICQAEEGEALPAGLVRIHGYATGAAGRPVQRVDVSADGGKTWVEAKLSEQNHPWTWCFWEAGVPLSRGSHQFIARATDSSGNTQPQDASKVWNFKGYMNNAWHRVNVQVE